MYMGFDVESNSIITSFRGSSNIVNWILNADFIKTDYVAEGCKDCEVHKGFYIAYNALKDEMLANLIVLTNLHPEATVVVTGHSLGGAEAMLAAVD